MLLLHRRIGETIMINDDISVTILSAVGNKVRIAIRAPKDVPVLREELVKRAQISGHPKQQKEIS